MSRPKNVYAKFNMKELDCGLHTCEGVQCFQKVYGGYFRKTRTWRRDFINLAEKKGIKINEKKIVRFYPGPKRVPKNVKRYVVFSAEVIN